MIILIQIEIAIIDHRELIVGAKKCNFNFLINWLTGQEPSAWISKDTDIQAELQNL